VSTPFTAYRLTHSFLPHSHACVPRSFVFDLAPQIPHHSSYCLALSSNSHRKPLATHLSLFSTLWRTSFNVRSLIKRPRTSLAATLVVLCRCAGPPLTLKGALGLYYAQTNALIFCFPRHSSSFSIPKCPEHAEQQQAHRPLFVISLSLLHIYSRGFFTVCSCALCRQVSHTCFPPTVESSVWNAPEAPRRGTASTKSAATCSA
jgi:hypothetical protein